MYLKITEPPLYQLQIACGFVRRAEEAQNISYHFAAATLTNIPIVRLLNI